MEVKIFTKAIIDLEEISTWYDLQSSGLGENFLYEIDTKILKICLNPFSIPIDFKGIRKAIIYKFPYHIYFDIEDKIYIYAILHARRNPYEMPSIVKLRKVFGNANE